MLHLEEFMDDLLEKHVFGKPIAYSFATEFQKRGLPHVHVVVTLRAEDKFHDPRRIDNVICAEIPDRNVNPKLYELVSTLHMHGPHLPHSQCMENVAPGHRCNKGFPKDFCEESLFVDNSYPEYRRTNNGRTVLKTIAPGETIELDNRWVVPYCPKMLLKYRLKYIFNKYYLNYEKNVYQIYNL